MMSLVPPVSVLLAKSGLIQKYDLSCVTSVVNGAAPLAPEVGDELLRQLGSHVYLRQGEVIYYSIRWEYHKIIEKDSLYTPPPQRIFLQCY